MLNLSKGVAIALTACLLAGGISLSALEMLSSQASEPEHALWTIEHEYWGYVQNNNLTAYRSLWHKDFLGWPLVSPAPVHKDHITDWITSQTSNGLSFKFIDFKPASIQVTGNVAVTYYWATYEWLDKSGAGTPHTTRVTHTWVKNGKDWQIIGGMSMLEPTIPQK